MKCAFQLVLPIFQESLKAREKRRQIILLPYIELQEFGVVWKAVMNFRGREAIPVQPN